MSACQTPILFCEPRRPKGVVSGDCWMLVPALAWQVVLGGDDGNSLNCFEKLVLNLTANANYSAQDLAALTHLHEDLIKQILRDLGARELLGTDNPGDGATNQGDQQAASKETCGWVFQDPFTGTIYPSFWSQLPFLDADQSTNLVKLNLGDEAQDYTKWAKPLAFPNQVPVYPSAREVVRSLKLRNSKEFQARLRTLTKLVHTVDYRKVDPLEQITIRKVIPLGNPVKVMLATAGIVLGEESTDWHVCCPVGTGLSRELKLRLGRSSEDGDKASEGIVRELCKHTSHGGIDDWRSALAMNQALAKKKLMEEFGPRINDFEGAVSQLLSFFEGWLLLESAGDTASPITIESVCNTSRKALEAIFKELGKRNPLEGLDDLLPGKNEEDHKALARQWAREMGFDDGDLPDEVLTVRKGWMKRDARDLKNYYSLSSVIGALLVQARMQEGHPLRLIGPREPGFFRLIGEIMRLGNPGSHDNSHKAVHLRLPGHTEVLGLRKTLVRVTVLLLDPSGRLFNHNH